MDGPGIRLMPVGWVLGGLLFCGACCTTGEVRAQTQTPGAAGNRRRRKPGRAEDPKNARPQVAVLPPHVVQAVQPAEEPNRARLIKSRCARRSKGVASAAPAGNRTPAMHLKPSVRLFRGRCHLH